MPAFIGAPVLTGRHQTLNNILLECSGISQQLFDTSQSLKVKRPERSEAGVPTKSDKKIPQKGCEWTSFRQALKTVWTSEYIQTLKARQSTCRQQLAISVLACLTSDLDVRSETGAGLPDVSKVQVVNVVSFHSGEIEPKQDKTNPAAEVLAVIVTLSNGKVQSMPLKSATSLKQWTTTHKQTTMQIHQPKEGHVFAITLAPFNPKHLRQNILSTLNVHQHKARTNQVQDAHKTTFDRIFHPLSESHKPSSDFPKWLESGHGCFWINGKPGSGKSTLMKYILQDPRTLSHLTKWASEAQLFTASNLLCNPSSPLQKTHSGLLRSLLHDILQHRPELIPVVIPELCKESIIQSQTRNHLKPHSLAQLKQWFNNLTHQANSSCRMFFQIDGIDEYEGDDPIEIISLIATTTSSHVKFLISSRPTPACTEHFASGPGLRLHDLTRHEMFKYCNSIIGKHLARHGYLPDRWPLIEEIVNKSSGVFLWLIFTAKSVLQGLHDGENITLLRKRLNELPTDLEELHACQIRKIPRDFRLQASATFQIHAKSRQIEQDIRGHPLLAVQLSFVGEEWDTVTKTPLTSLSRKKEQARVQYINRLLHDQCGGFLEVQNRTRRPRVKSLAEHVLSSSKVARPHVGFVHRTVAGFITDERVWAEIKSWNREFDPYRELFKSCIMVVKSFPVSEVVHPRASLVWESMYAGLRYAQLAEREGRPLPGSWLDGFDEVLRWHWESAQVYHQDGQYEGVEGRHWSTVLFHVRGEDGEGKGLDCTGGVDVGGGGNGFRYLVSASERCHGLIGRTEGLGFLRVAVVYGLGSYLKGRMAEGVATDLVRFWRDLLMSSFPMRVKMRAGTAFSFDLLDGVVHSWGNMLDCEDAFTVWNIFLVELCSSRDLTRLSAEQAEAVGKLASEFLQIYLVNRPWTAMSGRFGKLLLQLGGILKMKASGVGLYERLHKSVVVAAARGEKGKRSKINVVVVSRELTPLTSEGSTSGSGLTVDTGTIVSSQERLKLVLARLHEILGGGVGGKQLTHILKVGKGKLRLPMAKRRAQWREWELRGRRSVIDGGGM